MKRTSDPARRESALAWLMIAARRKNGVIEPRTIEFFNASRPKSKGCSCASCCSIGAGTLCRLCFSFLPPDPEPTEGQRSALAGAISRCKSALGTTPSSSWQRCLQSNRRNAHREVGAAGVRLTSLVWSQRKVLRAHCIEILQDGQWKRKS